MYPVNARRRRGQGCSSRVVLHRPTVSVRMRKQTCCFLRCAHANLFFDHHRSRRMAQGSSDNLPLSPTSPRMPPLSGACVFEGKATRSGGGGSGWRWAVCAWTEPRSSRLCMVVQRWLRRTRSRRAMLEAPLITVTIATTFSPYLFFFSLLSLSRYISAHAALPPWAAGEGTAYPPHQSNRALGGCSP